MGKFSSILRRFRDAITGRFVSKNYAERHPSTTVSERRRDPRTGRFTK